MNIFAVFILMYVIHYFGKKTMLIAGFVGMTFSHAFIALGLKFQIEIFLLIGVVGVVFSFGTSSGPITH